MNDPDLTTMQQIAEDFLTEPQPSADIFTAGPMVLEGPNWMDQLIEPWKEFGGSLITAGSQSLTEQYKQLPARLFDLGMEKLGGSQTRTVQTGPGTSITYVQPAEPGGAPANPYYAIVQPAAQQQPAVQQAGLSMSLVIVVIVIILLLTR